MTSYFNGGSLYTGILFNTGIDLLDLLYQSLPQEGWTVILNEINTNQILTLRGMTTNGHDCHIRFSIAGNLLQVQGDLEGDGAQLSPILSLPFDDGENNRFWMPCDHDAGAIAIKGKFLYNGAIYFGFPERRDSSDYLSWGISRLNNRLNDSIVARSRVNNITWHRIGDSFKDADNFTVADCNGPYQGIIDHLGIPNPFVSFFSTNVRNAGYSGHLGTVNADDDRQVLTRRFYLEGDGSQTNYDNGDSATGLYFRGFLKPFVINGFGSSVGGRKELDETGKRWLSSGDSSQGWQAICIADNPVVIPELPVIFRKDIGFITGNNFRTEISNVFQSGGWEVISETNLRSLFRAKFATSDDYFYLRSEIDGNNIVLQGDPNGLETNLSPKIMLPFTADSLNMTWETINQQSGVICVKNAADNLHLGAWLGFVKGRLPRFGIGYSSGRLDESFLFDPITQQWRSLTSGFTFALGDFSSFPTHGFDRLTVAHTPVRYFDYQDGNINSAALAYKGSLNPVNNKAELSFFPITEGESSALNYGLTAEGEGKSPKFPHLGIIEFMATGAASATGGTIINSDTGAKFLVTSDRGQAMRIS